MVFAFLRNVGQEHFMMFDTDMTVLTVTELDSKWGIVTDMDTETG